MREADQFVVIMEEDLKGLDMARVHGASRRESLLG